MIGIVDYGAGNLKSVRKAFAHLGFEAVVLDSPEGFDGVDKLVLPGVGSFGFAMDRIRERGLDRAVTDWAESGRPLFGICLGLQLLMEGSEESPDVSGFGFFRGVCPAFKSGKVPQIGWNSLDFRKEDPLFQGLHEGAFFYYCNSYYPSPATDAEVLAVSEYGVKFPSVLRLGNVSGVQFHPEKSGAAGMRLLENWVRSC
jgi:glutamine amidotransferase